MAAASTMPTVSASGRGVHRYGPQVNSHDLVKVLAILTMVVDHIGKYFLYDNIWMRLVGRMAAPLFFYLVGYSGSYRFKYQILALGIALGLIEFFVGDNPSFVWRIMPFNILISFVLIKLILNRFDPAKMRSRSLILWLAVLVFVSYETSAYIEFGSLGLSIAVGSRLIHKRHPFGRPWITVSTTAHFLLQMNWFLFMRPDVPMQIIPVATLLLASIFALSLFLFLKYELRTFTVNPAWLRAIVLYVSRYSLHIYFFHLAAFKIVHSII